MQTFLYKISLIGICVCIISLGIDAVYRHQYHLRYQVLPNILTLPAIVDKYELVSLGNSHAEDGLTFDKYRLRSLKLSSVAQSFDFDLAHLIMHNRQIKPGAVILISVSPISFSQKKSGPDDKLQTKYYDGQLSPFLIPNIKVGDYVQSQILPFLRAGFLLREKYNKQVMDKVAAGLKDPALASPAAVTADQEPPWPIAVIRPEDLLYNVQAINRELTLTIPPTDQLKESASLNKNKWYDQDAFSQNYFSVNQKDLRRLIDYCYKKKWQPVLITLPITQELLDSLRADYRQRYIYDNLQTLDRHGIDYFDYLAFKPITQNTGLFSNSDHLNQKGAAGFSYVILQKLIEKGYLSKDVDGYDHQSFETLIKSKSLQ